MSTYDFSTLYTALPHHLIKDILIDLINRTFIRENTQYFTCNEECAFLLLLYTRIAIYDLIKKSMTPLFIFWITYLLDLELNFIGKLLVFRWELIVLLLLEFCIGDSRSTKFVQMMNKVDIRPFYGKTKSALLCICIGKILKIQFLEMY